MRREQRQMFQVKSCEFLSRAHRLQGCEAAYVSHHAVLVIVIVVVIVIGMD